MVLCPYVYLAAAALSRLRPGSLVSSPLAAVEASQAGDKGLVFIPVTGSMRQASVNRIHTFIFSGEKKRKPNIWYTGYAPTSLLNLDHLDTVLRVISP